MLGGNGTKKANDAPAWAAAGMPCLIKEVLYAPPCPEKVALLLEVALTHHNTSAYDLGVKTYLQALTAWEDTIEKGKREDAEAQAAHKIFHGPVVITASDREVPLIGRLFVRLATASIYDSAAADAKALAELMEAQRLCNQLPQAHPIQGTVDSMLGITYAHLSQFDLAADHFLRCLELREFTLGAQHVDTGATLNNIGVCLHCMDKSSDALVMYYRAEEIFKTAFRVEHPRTVTVTRNIGRAKHTFLKDATYTLPEAKPLLIQPSNVCGVFRLFHLFATALPTLRAA